MFVSGLSLTYLKSSRYYFLHLESRVSGTMYNIGPRSWVSVPTFRFLGLGSLAPPTSYFPVLDLRCHGTSVMVLQIGLRYWVLGLTKSSGFWVPLLWYVNNFGIIGKIIWFRTWINNTYLSASYQILFSCNLLSTLAEEVFKLTTLHYNVFLIRKLTSHNWLTCEPTIRLEQYSIGRFLSDFTQNHYNIVNSNCKKHLFHNTSITYHASLTKQGFLWKNPLYLMSLCGTTKKPTSWLLLWLNFCFLCNIMKNLRVNYVTSISL